MLFLAAALLPLPAFVGAQSSFANATTSKATLPASSSSLPAASGSSSCPKEEDCDRSGDPGYPIGYGDIYVYEYPGSINSQCSMSFMNSLSSWMATATVASFTEVYTDQSNGLPYLTQYDAQFASTFSFKAVEPCCGNCSLFGGDVQVYYWPTPAPTPGVTELVNSDNYTFTSPSVYVAFNSLYATNLCGSVGKFIEATTLAFAPDALSTAIAYHDTEPGPVDLQNNFTVASFGMEPKVCNNITSSFSGLIVVSGDFVTSYSFDDFPASLSPYCSATPDYCNFEEWEVTYNPCSPTLSVPTQLFTLNAEWKGCNPGIDAFFDPPYTLTQGSGLNAFNSPTAQPQTTPNAPTPTPTARVTTSADTHPSVDPSLNPSPSIDPPPPVKSSSNLPPPQPPSKPADPSPSTKSSPNSPPSQPPSIPADPSPLTKSSPNSPPPQPPSKSADPSPSIQSSPNSPPSQPLSIPADPSPSIQSSLNSPPSQLPSISADPPPSLATSASPDPSNSPNSSPNQPALPQEPQSTDGSPAYLSTQNQPQPTRNSSPAESNTLGTTRSTTPVPFVAGTQTIVPGSSAIVISGTTYSVPSSGGAVIINNSITKSIPQPQASGDPNIDPTPTYVLGSQTMVVGGSAITISQSIVVSLMSGGQSVVVQGSSTTETLAVTAMFTSTEGVLPSTGLGGVIVSIGGFTTPAPTSTSAGGNGTLATFFGSGSRLGGKENFRIWIIGAGVAALGILVL